MRKITEHNRKGGVGKSTFTINLASALAAAGFHVGIADGDGQCNTTALAWTSKRREPLFKNTLTKIVREEGDLLSSLVQVRKNLWLVPADLNLHQASEHIRSEKDYEIMPDLLERLEARLQIPPPLAQRLPWWSQEAVDIRIFKPEETTDEDYLTAPTFLDFFFFDTPPDDDDDLAISILYASDELIVPMTMEEFSVQGLAQMLEKVGKRLKRRKRGIVLSGIIPNDIQHTDKSTLYLDYLEDLYRTFPHLARRPVHHDKVIYEAQGSHCTALELDRHARATRELCLLALELAGYPGTFLGVPSCKKCSAAYLRAQDHEEVAQA